VEGRLQRIGDAHPGSKEKTVTRRRRSVLRSFCLTFAATCLLLVFAGGSWSGTAAAAPKNCVPSVYMGSRWAVAAQGVSCLYAKTWLPKMYAAPSAPGGKWSGPAGWICVKVQRDPGHVTRGVCETATHKLMAWKVIGKA
jgi:hypothetical protein